MTLSKYLDSELKEELEKRSAAKKSILAFSLSMPGSPSWNGKWSGQDKCYVLVKSFSSTIKSKEKAKKILEKKSFHYRWEDGWAARVEVTKISPKEARALKKKTQGFCGYDWMVDSIVRHLEIKCETN